MKIIFQKIIRFFQARITSISRDRDYSAFQHKTLEDYKAEILAKYPHVSSLYRHG